ncbi:MAG: hypothetical protein K1X92_12025 [Bacteroidia bacterium]|nr:hypothetical protein [Bacteroidia bacterium]
MKKDTWFYALSAKITAEEEAALLEKFHLFLNQWKSHGTPVSGEIAVKEKRIIMIQSDNSVEKPSGCSIDGMKRSIEGILHSMHLTWEEPSVIFYRKEDGEMEKVDFREIGNRVKQGEINPETPVMDFTLNNTDNPENLERPLSQTWMRRLI